MKFFLILLSMILIFGLVWLIAALPVENLKGQDPDIDLLTLSEELLYNVKTESPTDQIETELSKHTVDQLHEGLPNDNARKTFWINIYNAYYQILAIQHKLTPPQIFNEKAIHFADASFSLDDVEHGILRKYRWKFSLGYLPQFLPSKTMRKLAVEEIDFRIHFALNCGAKSCPPIAFYNYENIEEQLELATQSFLENDTEIDEETKTVHVTRLMQWFKADFHGDKGIKSILSRYLDRDFSGYKIEYKEYDWSEDLRNFSTDSKM